ncbi:hypothetical protein WDU94_002290 [Cyamophila willieti]
MKNTLVADVELTDKLVDESLEHVTMDQEDLIRESSPKNLEMQDDKTTVENATKEDKNDLTRELVEELFEEVTKELDDCVDEMEIPPGEFEESEAMFNREEINANKTKQVHIEKLNSEKRDTSSDEKKHIAVVGNSEIISTKMEGTIQKTMETPVEKPMERGKSTTPNEVTLNENSIELKTGDKKKIMKLRENKSIDVITTENEIKENDSCPLINGKVKSFFNSYMFNDKSTNDSHKSSEKTSFGNVNTLPPTKPTNPFVRKTCKPVMVKLPPSKPTNSFVPVNSKPLIVNIENAKRQLARPKCFKKLIEINMWDKEKKDKDRKDALKATMNKENHKTVEIMTNASVKESETKTTETSRNNHKDIKLEHNTDGKTVDGLTSSQENTVKTETGKTKKDSVIQSEHSLPKSSDSETTSPKRKNNQEGKVKNETPPDRNQSKDYDRSETMVISLEPQKLGIHEDELIRALQVIVRMDKCDGMVGNFVNKMARLTETQDNTKDKTPETKCNSEKDLKHIKYEENTTREKINARYVSKKTATTMEDMLKISKERQLLKKQKSLELEKMGREREGKVLQDVKNNKPDKSEGEQKKKLDAESLNQTIERYQRVKKTLEKRLAKQPNKAAMNESYLNKITTILQKLLKRKKPSENSEKKQSFSNGNCTDENKGESNTRVKNETCSAKITIQQPDNRKEQTKPTDDRNKETAVKNSNVKQVDEIINKNKMTEDHSDSKSMEEISYNIEEMRRKSVELLQSDKHSSGEDIQLPIKNTDKVQTTTGYISTSTPAKPSETSPKANCKLSEEKKVKELKRLLMIKKQLQELKNKKNLMEKSESKLKENQNAAALSGNGKCITPIKTSETAPLPFNKSPNFKMSSSLNSNKSPNFKIISPNSKIIVPAHMLPQIRLDPCDDLANEYRKKMMNKSTRKDTFCKETSVDNPEDDFVSALKRQIAQEIKNKVKVSPSHDNYNASSSSPRQQITTSAMFELEELRMKKNDIITVYNRNQMSKELSEENKRKERRKEHSEHKRIEESQMREEPSEDINRHKERDNESINFTSDKEEIKNSTHTNTQRNTNLYKSTGASTENSTNTSTQRTCTSNRENSTVHNTKNDSITQNNININKTTAPISSNYSIFEENEFMKRYVKPLQLTKNDTTNKSEEKSEESVENASKPLTKNIGDETADMSGVNTGDNAQNEEAILNNSESDSNTHDNTDDSESEKDGEENTTCKDAKSNLFEQLQKDFLNSRGKYKHVDFVQKVDDKEEDENDEHKDDKSRIFEKLEKQFYNNPAKYMKHLRDPKNRKLTLEEKVEENSKANLFEALEQEFYNNQDKYESGDTEDGKMDNDEDIIEINENDNESLENKTGKGLEVGNKVETTHTTLREEHTSQEQENIEDNKCDKAENSHEKEHETNEHVGHDNEKSPEDIISNNNSVTSDSKNRCISKGSKEGRRKGKKNVKDNRSKRESVENNVDTIEDANNEERDHTDKGKQDKYDRNTWETWDVYRYVDRFIGFKIPEKITAIRKLSNMTDFVILIEQYLARNRTSDIKHIERKPNETHGKDGTKAKKRRKSEAERNTSSENKNDNLNKNDEEFVPQMKRKRDVRASEESGYGSQQDEPKPKPNIGEAVNDEEGERMKVPLLKISRNRIVPCKRDKKYSKAIINMEDAKESDYNREICSNSDNTQTKDSMCNSKFNKKRISENNNEIDEIQDDDRNEEVIKEYGESDSNSSDSDEECENTTQTHYSKEKEEWDSTRLHKDTRTIEDTGGKSTSSKKQGRRQSFNSEDRDSWEPYTQESLQSVLDAVNNDINDHVQVSVKVQPSSTKPVRRAPAPIQQRYDASDLYKPRLNFASKRRRVELPS